MLHSGLFLISILSLAQAANLIRLAGAPIEVIGFWRLFGAGLIMGLWALLHGGLLRGLNHRSRSWALLSGVFFFLHLWTYFYSAKNTSIANCMILFATNPLYTGLITRLTQKALFPARLKVAYSLAFGGIVFLFLEKISFSLNSLWGDLAGLAAAIFYSFYITTGQTARSHMNNSSYTAVIYMLTALLFLATGLSQDLSWTSYPATTWWSILGLIFIPTLLGHALFTYLVKFLDINWMSCGKLIEPVIAALIAYFLFSETITPTTMTAFFLTSTSVILLYWPSLASAFKKLSTSE